MPSKTFDQVASELRGKPILVANRGIPARRVARAIREVIQGVPIMTATDVDKTSPATTAAEELILLGDNPRAYLDLDLIIRKAKERGVVAIHPGWGFAAEDDHFPQLCRQAGIVFIGPGESAMKALGNKVAAREVAQRLGIPTVPGSSGAVDLEGARRLALELGYPLMLKAEGGGGGRGIYPVFNEAELLDAFSRAEVMAQAAFGNPRIFVERYLRSVRHIEIQVVADQHGNALALDERDCSLQRKHQKLVEITPSPWSGMTPELRQRLKNWSSLLVREVGYSSLATVEFLVEPDGNAYMVEVNTRLQVEHGITEARYGIDLVEEQIALAFGSELRYGPSLEGMVHAMEARINCEDPQEDFSPNSGRVVRYISPGGQGVRIESCVNAGYDFPPDYDSAASLLVTYGRSFEKTRGLMERALREYIIRGVKTTIPFIAQVIAHPKFAAADFDTKFLETTPELMRYRDAPPRFVRNSRLAAEISARGYNPHVQLGAYRTRTDKRVGALTPILPEIDFKACCDAPYPRFDRKGLLDAARDGTVHFTDTTTRDITQSNSGNRFRLAEDRLVGPYLDNCAFFSLENGGGAHFHVAMLANMTYPFYEAAQWNAFAPKTPKQILVRSTNLLGYKPHSRNLMRLFAEEIATHYDIIRCFDFLNHAPNMRPFAEAILASERNVFEPAISLSFATGFDVPHYLGVARALVSMAADILGVSEQEASRKIILGLKDMAGVCPPRFVTALVTELRRAYPDLVLVYHRHYTDGLFVPAVAAAAKAGCHIIDAGLGAAVRWYGQGDALATAAYLEDELGLPTHLRRDLIRHSNFVLSQLMPYFDRYTAPRFQGIDHDVVEHAMPGGATSSSQEGALKQGYIHLLPYMRRYLAATRRIIRYHDVTPGSQITWNTAFLGVTDAFKRGGTAGVESLLQVMDQVANLPEHEQSPELKKARLDIYRGANDALRDLLLGKFGPLPLGFPPDWVYESAFGEDFRGALERRVETSPLDSLEEVDIEAQRTDLASRLRRDPTHEELLMYLAHPTDALKTIEFQERFGNPNQLPVDVWFEGLEVGQKLTYVDGKAKPHEMQILSISPVDDQGVCTVRYTLDHQFFAHQVKVQEASGQATATDFERGDPKNPFHVIAPSGGDLWVTHVKPGDSVQKGDELCNLSIMKQEKAILAPTDAVVKRVLKTASYQTDRKMVPVKPGELLIELGPKRPTCASCDAELEKESYSFCPRCGSPV